MDEMIQANETIETSSSWARRRTTGAKFSLNPIPPEFSEFECEYENPDYELTIGFHARWIYEQKELERNGKLVPWPLCTGAILVEGELKQLLVTAVGGRASEGEIDGLVHDCHELLYEFIRGQHEFNRFGVEPHIYVVDARRFGFLNLHGTEVGPDAVATSQAKLVV
jgi:hypothetical protein